MADDSLLALVRQLSPSTGPSMPEGLRRRTPVVDQFFTEGQLYQIRSTVAAHASSVTNDPERIGVAVLITSELVINAIRHAGGYGWLRVWLDDRGLSLQVADQGPGLDPTAGTVRPTPGQAHHRGLWIVRELANTVSIETGPTGTSVIVRLVLAEADTT